MKPDCGNCAFWKQTDKETSSGYCRRHAPRLVHSERDEVAETLWPVTEKWDYCGEHSRSKPITGEYALDLASAERNALVECECPVCARIKRVIEGVGGSQDIGDSIGLGIVENPSSWPQNRSGLWRPDLHEFGDFFPSIVLSNAGERTAENAKEDVTDAKSRRLYIIGSDVWMLDGRRA